MKCSNNSTDSRSDARQPIADEGGKTRAPAHAPFSLAALDDLMAVVEQLGEREPDRPLCNDRDQFML